MHWLSRTAIRHSIGPNAKKVEYRLIYRVYNSIQILVEYVEKEEKEKKEKKKWIWSHQSIKTSCRFGAVIASNIVRSLSMDN